MSVVEGVQTKATVKWFNGTKGFGFVAPADGTPDAFLHVSVLNRAGLQALNDGAELSVEIGRGPKGPQVLRIIEVLDPGQPSARPSFGDRDDAPRQRFGGDRDRGFGGDRDRSFGGDRYGDRDRDRGGFGGRDNFRADPTGPQVEMSGTVKWFKEDKGFGFVTADDQDKDVFVHKSVLRRCGLEQLEAGQRVQMKVTEAAKGREATWISTI